MVIQHKFKVKKSQGHSTTNNCHSTQIQGQSKSLKVNQTWIKVIQRQTIDIQHKLKVNSRSKQRSKVRVLKVKRSMCSMSMSCQHKLKINSSSKQRSKVMVLKVKRSMCSMTFNTTSRSKVKGQKVNFVEGHSTRRRPTTSSSSPSSSTSGRRRRSSQVRHRHRCWHLRYFLIFSILKNYFWGIFFQVK